ncbi:OLC1v1027036C1 [Oldenlandia corymbosa var. corymbosa]|uniref:OLC1v1027036C1 n=1 Tax=Oldenlandia corymbosa var. corymbosa TaxID=529605 RepID=A0AAV1C8H6_OLDCO|nr:OLC1v1027036C1 [Oldenlandia corymbosa var. corymbosa]
MSKPSSSRLILTYLRRCSPKPSSLANPNDLTTSSGISKCLSYQPRLIRDPILSPWLSNSQRTHFSSTPLSRIFQNPSQKIHNPTPNLAQNCWNFVGLRYFSALPKKDAGKRVMGNAAGAVKNVASKYREAVGLQIDAFWKRNSLVLVGAGGVVVCITLWRIMFGIANTFVGLSEGMAKYGFLALSTAIVAFFGLYLRSRYTINPDRVYRMAMRKLNTSAGILEVMGAPLTGTDLRAYVMSGGGIALNKFKPRLRSKRCFLIFPIRGSERKGLVNVEVKNKKGQYDMKLLAVDIPMARGPDQRIYLVGDDEEYRVGGDIISELRDPVVKALAASKEFEDLDDQEDEEDAERERQEAERKHREEVDKLEKTGS